MLTIKLSANQSRACLATTYSAHDVCVALRDMGFSATRMPYDKVVTTAPLDTIKTVVASAQATFTVV